MHNPLSKPYLLPPLGLSALFTVWLGLTSVATAAADLAVTSPLCSCHPESEDTLEGPSQINFGAFSGQCVDSCRFRKSIRLSSAITPAKQTEDGTVVISNFMHGDSYWKAKIPVSQVQSVDVGFEEFRPGIFHVFLLFHFPADKPIRLLPQVLNGGRRPTTVSSLVISPEGIPPKNGNYNFFDAYMERYPIGIRMMSKEQVIGWSINKLKHPVQIFTLLITPEQGAEILRGGLSSGDQKSFRVRYGLFSNNCATNVVDLIDNVIKPDVAKYPLYFSLVYPLERALPIAGPLGTLQIFISRNLIEQNSGRKMVN